MKRWIMRISQNADTLIPLILGIGISLLGLLGLVSSHILNNSILITLSVLSFALLRDRWREESAENKVKVTSEQTLSLLNTLRINTAPLATLDQLITRMNVTIQGVATVRTLRGTDINAAFAEARLHTDRWMFRGGTGTYIRAITLPQCVENARRDRRALQVRLEILDPTDEDLCGIYTRYRTSLATGADGTGELWTTDRTRKESFATIVAAYWHQQNYQMLDISVGLSSRMTTFRYDLSATCVIITQEDVNFPAVIISNSSPLYDGYVTELRTSLSQARHVPYEDVKVLFGDPPTHEQVRTLFNELRLPLPDWYSNDDVRQVIDKAMRAKSPY